MMDIHNTNNNIDMQTGKSAESYARGAATTAGNGVAGSKIAGEYVNGSGSFAREFEIKHAAKTDAGTYSNDVNGEQSADRSKNANETDSSYDKEKESAKRADKKITGEDARDIEDMGMSLKKFTATQLDRIIDTIKQMRNNTQEAIDEQVIRIEEIARQFDDIARLDENDIAKLLRAADIPVNSANISKLAHTLEMAAVIPAISDETKVYMVENNTPLTIADFYRASYSSAGIAIGVGISDDVFESLRVRIEEIATTENEMADARWLLDNGLAVNEETLKYISDINDIQNSYSTKAGVAFITDSMRAGEDPAKASLLSMRAGMAFQAISVIEARSFGDNEHSFDNILKEMKELRVQLLADLYGLNEELEKASDVLKENVNNNIPAEISDIGELEQASSSVIYGQAAMDRATKEIYERFEIAVRTMNTVWAYGDLRQSGEDEFGKVDADSFGKELSLNNYSQALDRYEEGQTQIRSDLGDSIKKAFVGIESLLETEGIEVTRENVAATKLLGYAGLDVTQENVQDMKVHMMKVSSTFDALKPAVVVKMVKAGINPLDMGFDELKETADRFSIELGGAREEKYSEYLYKLEHNSQLSEEERNAYIGIYRLINAVQSTDNAAIATTVKAGREFTMANLLSAVRTLRGGGIDQTIDDEFGGIDKIVGKIAIDEQIAAAAAEIKNEIDGSRTDNNRYENSSVDSYKYENIIIAQTEQRLSDGSLVAPGVDNIQHIVDTNLEKLAFVDTNPEKIEFIDKSELSVSAGIDTSVFDENVVSFLEGNGLSLTIENVALAGEFIKGTNMVGYDKELEERFVRALDNSSDEGADSDGNGVNAITELGAFYEEKMSQLESSQSQAVMMQDNYENADLEMIRLRRISFVRKLGRSNVYEVPMKDEEGNDMDVRLAFKAGKRSSVDVAMFSEKLGRVKAVAKVNEKEISVSILSDSVKGVDILKENSGELVDALATRMDMEVKIDYARMQTGEAFDLTGKTHEEDESYNATTEGGYDGATRMDTGKLCRMAGTLIEYIRKAC